MSDDRTIDTTGIVEIVDGDIPEILIERQKCDSAVDGDSCLNQPAGEIRGLGRFCGQHYDETIQAVRAAAEHLDNEHAATIPDDVVAEYARDCPMAAEWEARQLASMRMRDRLLVNPYYGQKVPDGLIVPGMTAFEERERLRSKYQNLRVIVALRSTTDLRPPEPEEVVSLTVKQREWEGRDPSTRQAQLVDLFNETVTGTWGAHVEARGGMYIVVDGKDFDAYWTLLHLSRGYIPPAESLNAVTVVAPIASPTVREEAATGESQGHSSVPDPTSEFEEPRRGRFPYRDVFLHEVGWLLSTFKRTEQPTLEAVCSQSERMSQVGYASVPTLKGALREWFGGKWRPARQAATLHYLGCTPGPSCDPPQVQN